MIHTFLECCGVLFIAEVVIFAVGCWAGCAKIKWDPTKKTPKDWDM